MITALEVDYGSSGRLEAAETPGVDRRAVSAVYSIVTALFSQFCSGTSYLQKPLILFSDIFTQVTEGKQDLEQALQLSRKLKEESFSLSKWLEATEAELVHKSTTQSLLADLDTEIAWAKVRTTILCSQRLLSSSSIPSFFSVDQKYSHCIRCENTTGDIVDCPHPCTPLLTFRMKPLKLHQNQELFKSVKLLVSL